MANREREDNIYYARLAEQGERYEDMIRYMKEVANVSTYALSDTSNNKMTFRTKRRGYAKQRLE